MQIDHIFIFSNNYGAEADQLIEFGLSEGSNRIHPGQGTRNRKFYFDNFFLEILWVFDEKDIKNEVTSVTKLWERSQFHSNGCSPFGLCLENSESTDKLFRNCELYFPNYLPEGKSIEFISNDKFPQLPWTFRTPFKKSKIDNKEPNQHKKGIRSLTKTVFEIGDPEIENRFTAYFDEVSTIHFIQSPRIHLVLEFDDIHQQKEMTFQDLNLTIRY